WSQDQFAVLKGFLPGERSPVTEHYARPCGASAENDSDVTRMGAEGALGTVWRSNRVRPERAGRVQAGRERVGADTRWKTGQGFPPNNKIQDPRWVFLR